MHLHAITHKVYNTLAMKIYNAFAMKVYNTLAVYLGSAISSLFMSIYDVYRYSLQKQKKKSDKCLVSFFFFLNCDINHILVSDLYHICWHDDNIYIYISHLVWNCSAEWISFESGWCLSTSEQKVPTVLHYVIYIIFERVGCILHFKIGIIFLNMFASYK